MHYAASAGCWGYQGGTSTPPSRCTRAPEAAGLVFYASVRRQSVRVAFACPDHVDDLIAARPLHDRDREEMARRRRRNEQQVGDLAVGREARELVERARRWAAAHPELTYRRPPVDAYASSDGGRTTVAGPAVSRDGSR